MKTIKIKGKEFVEVDEDIWMNSHKGFDFRIRSVDKVLAFYMEKRYLPKTKTRKCSKCNGTGVVK